MWAIAINANGEIAVHAKYSETFRVTPVFEPPVKRRTRSTDLFSMPVSTTMHMVDREKLFAVFGTARAVVSTVRLKSSFL
jgi:hypothetical protein